MNCPGHMLLFGSQLRSYRDLPLRYAEAAPLHRNELAGALHGLTRVRYVTQDDAHIFCTEEQVDAELDGSLEYLRYLYGLFGIEPRAELSTRPDNKLGTDERVGLHRGQARRGARPARDRVLRRRGRGLVLRAEDRPPHHRRRCGARGSSARSSSTRRCRPASGSPTWARTTRSTPVFVIHRALFGSFERFIGDPDRALRRRLPALARARAGARAAGERAAPRGARAPSPSELREAGFRVELDERDETLGKRIRDSELEKIPVVVVFGERESEAALAVRTRGEGQSTRVARRAARATSRRGAPLRRGRRRRHATSLAAATGRARPATLGACKVGAVTLTSGATGCAGSTESNDEGNGAAACQRFLTFQGRISTVLKRDTAW